MKLSSLCALQMGYTARSRLEPASEGGVLALQLRDISADGDIGFQTLSRVQLPELSERYMVGSGDVVFRSRGERTTATAIDESMNEQAVAILPLIILRPNPSMIAPQFLAWSINLPANQRNLDASAQGSSIRMVPKSALDDLRIDVPDLATQRRIVAAANLARREAALAASLAEKSLSLTTLALADAAKRASERRPSERSKP
ncbi:restriction endonuclease subunit S [Phenylobacterium sp.]|uniref:restriction endonuclease subunit S n=1 Tax=Phenylobacterium sp. TaxID=1871053 RepID=UPI00271E678E|nr:restriction endonuclease subunit S [Phenylobacterium sp.]MDO8381009.1 restriction endonuclease subunit S [Phenylobacterium sp.]